MLNLPPLRLVAATGIALLFSACGSEQGASAAPEQRNADHEHQPFSAASHGTFIVDSEGDEPDALQGDGVCETADGLCTLRAAIQESNATVFLTADLFNNTNAIILPEGHFKFIEPPLIPTVVAEGTSDAGMLSVLGSTNIRGAGARKTIIDGNQIDRVFGVGPNALLTISDATITGGTASGIFNQGQLTVTRVTVTGNRATSGGGIFNTPTSYAIIDSSTISNNIADNEGGGIRFDSTGLVINSTISGNILLDSCCTEDTADGGTAGEGGGIDARGGGPVTIINSTIVNNHAVIGGGGINIAFAYQGDPGGLYDESGTELLGRPIELINTIIAGNTSTFGAANCKHTVSEIFSLGGNVSDDDSCELNARNDKPNTDPLFAPLADNGGPTDTHDLFLGSPARRNGLSTTCPYQDQMGVARLRPCDAGAVEGSLN